MTPEATFFTELASGRLPALGALLVLLAFVLRNGGSRLDKLTAAVEALPAALTAHRDATMAGAGEIKAHVSMCTERVIGAIENHRLSEIEEVLGEVKRAASNPDLEPPATRRGASGTRPAAR